ncbi:hypothetical protein PsorP6_004450 [Peronosclerospora sorghi]|uniref:Uncharacterized protein n=1 Tax=Peronosclerospora sorghi TaxID=230839 RepID=A0ACC0VIW1_9STRA|nr:hypothetical protein PsorP6_004450 [Peronosclerospora sorghi]
MITIQGDLKHLLLDEVKRRHSCRGKEDKNRLNRGPVLQYHRNAEVQAYDYLQVDEPQGIPERKRQESGN